jgi:uncharacterized membrane protein YozB (DUF420 family)
MKNLKLILLVQFLVVSAYTAWAFYNEGPNLFGVFMHNLQSLNWNGQFNLDFSCYLILSGCWIAWRGNYAPSAIAIGLTASILGIVFFAPYLLYLLQKENGNLMKVFVGKRVEQFKHP